MNSSILHASIAMLLILCRPLRAAESDRSHAATPVPFNRARITGGFWKAHLDVNAGRTLPHVLDQCRTTGRIGNFEIAAGKKDGKHEGNFFNDSDVYKILEGAAYVIHHGSDKELEGYCDGFIETIAAAQETNGYLNTHYQLKEKPERRWQNVSHKHELYCAGHMFEAAVAYYEATGKRRFLDCAVRFADLIDTIFGPGRRLDPPGHQEIEMGLVRLYRATGTKRYLDLARFFLDQRGNPNRGKTGKWYQQDHALLVDQAEAVGHAVRAVYGYSAMADVAMTTGDRRYTSAVDRLWKNVVSRKMSLTGGIGGGLWEAFDREYFLPNTSVYNETCGAIANVLWNHRMFQLHGDAGYLDVLERTLYNGALGGVALSGDKFFYPNKLESRGAQRQPWFKCACCPSNVARFIPSVSQYMYATRGDTLVVGLYAENEADVQLVGRSVRLTQRTEYPWDGKIRIEVNPEREAAFAVALRIPGWARNQPVPSDLYRYAETRRETPTLEINSEPVDLRLEDGFVVVRRTWKKGDSIRLDLPMPVRRVLAHDALRDNIGRVALERGPLVYCVEGLDLGRDGTETLNLRIPDNARFGAERREDLLGGVTVVTCDALEVSRAEDKVSIAESGIPLVAIPYFARSNRDPTAMVVWMLRDRTRAILPPTPTIASISKATASVGRANFGALSDQILPARSGDASRGTFVWQGRRGTQEWVQYDFAKSDKVSAVEVYWYARFGTAVKLPESWKLMYRDGDQWLPVRNTAPYGLLEDRPNRVTFGPVETDGLRIQVKLQDQYVETYLAGPNAKPSKMSGGILEWRVE